MFKGTTPPEVKLLLQDLMQEVKKKDVFIGCSGNFTTDKLVAGLGFTVHSNDVSLYSKLISDLLLGTDTEVTITNQELAELFDTWEDSPYKKLVQVMYAMRLSEYKDRKNDYQQYMYEAFAAKSAVYYHNTCEKLAKGALNFQIADFAFCDFLDFLKSKKGKGVGISFPPTYKAGYERIFKYVEESFAYEHAPYTIFDPKEGETIFGTLLDDDENVIYSDRDWPNLHQWLIGKCVIGSGKKPVYMYSSVHREKRYFMDKCKLVKASKYKVIETDYRFTKDTQITVECCPVNDINYFKAFFMSNKVDYSTGGDLAFVFLADGRAFGFLVFSKQLSSITEIFMQADFVANSDQAKLSKLLIMLAKSAQLRKFIARKWGNYYTKIKTTVYTDKAVSMKYRGCWSLIRRDQGKLMYGSEFEEKSFNEIYLQWLTKYQKTSSK